MKKLIFITLVALLTNVSYADIIIRNKNTNPDYSMHVTYRSCEYRNSLLQCDPAQTVDIAKASDYRDSKTPMLLIDEVALINVHDNSTKAQSTYIQYPKYGSTVTGCSAWDDYPDNANKVFHDNLLILNDRNSPYIVCEIKKHINK